MRSTEILQRLLEGRGVREDGAAYTERYVAYFDLVGFSDLVERSDGPDADLVPDEILSAIEVPEPAGERKVVLGKVGDISRSGHTLHRFSDSVFITTDPTEPALLHLIHHVWLVGFCLACQGRLYRGAITKGRCLMRGTEPVGPAVVEAVRLEKSVGVPRVILAGAALGDAERASEQVFIERYTRIFEDDGVRFVDYLRWFRSHADQWQPIDQRTLEFWARIQGIIDREKARVATDPDKLRKWEWFYRYFRWATDRTLIERLMTGRYPQHTWGVFPIMPQGRS